jgi:hypothetical protein
MVYAAHVSLCVFAIVATWDPKSWARGSGISIGQRDVRRWPDVTHCFEKWESADQDWLFVLGACLHA